MIDPKGDDDYFNADGSFSHRTNSGNNIFVITKNGNKLLHEMPLNNLHQRIIVIRIIKYYAQMSGIPETIGLRNMKPDKEDKELNSRAAAASEGENIFINSAGGRIDKLLSNYNNLISTLKHEKNHQKDFREGKKQNELRSLEAILNHAIVYGNEIHSKLFEFTSKEFQESAIKMYAYYLQKAYNNRDKSWDISEKQLFDKLNKMIDTFNTNEGKKYGWFIAIYDGKNYGVNIHAVKIRKKK